MKKFFVFLFSFVFIGTAFAAGENVPTSKSYVDSVVAEKQDKISANNGGAQVLTNTGTAGEYGTKNIYDASSSYAGQSDALIDAGTMNSAVQNAIDNEFECVEDDGNGNCLLTRVVGADMGIQPGDGEWFRAYLNYESPTRWTYISADASSSIRIPIKTNVEYKLYWDGDYSDGIYRVAFVKTDTNPSTTDVYINVYKADGTPGSEFRSNTQTYPSYTFKVTDNDIKYLVVQISGSGAAWNTGDFSYLWNRISHLHLVENNYLPSGQ
ncbi:MAG: hypothetical protein IKO56_05410 [Alphaproteobacteria bacterium]|nr:hypothetical protein [Alphaproteobacteria bacterium]